MSSDSQDSEGEELPAILPGLIRQLQNVLNLYPDDGQILKELIQNAEDAGATEVKILTDMRRFNQDLDKRRLKKRPHLKFFKGPALCVYNDAEFTDFDWEGIRRLHTSVKEKDPLKVGRFGLGFKSVFHLTDRLVIMSGEHIMYMDPFKGESSYCNTHYVAKRKGRELQSILHSLRGVFGVGEETFGEAGGRFPGTLFWFPLRQSASDLCSTVYTEQSVQSLMASFRTEAPSLLLFLSHIQNVQLFTRDEACELREVFSVGIASSCLQTVLSERQRFTENIASAKDGLPENEIYCITEVVMETKDYITSPSDTQRWLVANYHCGRMEISSALSKLCSDPELSYRPSVGVAIPLTNCESFQSQVFCFLPLPLDTRSPTGLPVHVHGYFALDQNRRHLKWPSADQLLHKTQLEPATQWNCLLVTELLPRVYAQAILRLQRLHSNDPGTFYRAWPDLSNIHDRWKPLLKPLYKFLLQQPVFFSHTRGGHWVPLLEAVLQRFSQHFTAEVEKSVVKVYAANSENLVELPEPVHSTLLEFGLLNNVKIINAARVSQLIPSCLHQLDRSDKLCLLHYLYQNGIAFLMNQPLLPLANQQFGTFSSRQNQHTARTFWCPVELVQLFPGLEGEFCDYNVPAYVSEDLRQLAESGVLSLEKLDQNNLRIPELLQKSLQTKSRTAPPALSIDDPWIERVWQFLALIDLFPFRYVSLLPTKKISGNPMTLFLTSKVTGLTLLPLGGVYVSSAAGGMVPLSSDLVSALTKLGVTVLHELPDYISGHRQVLGNFVNYPSSDGVLKVIKSVKTSGINSFNSNSTREEKAALIQLLSDVRDIHDTHIQSICCQLELFTVAFTGRPASIDQVSDIGPNNLPPISPARSLLACGFSEKSAALNLKATEVTLYQIVQEMLYQMSLGQYSAEDVINFMKYFLNSKSLMTESQLLHMAKEVQFLRTGSGQLKLATSLYDPSSSVLQELFHTQHNILFPQGEFSQPEMLKKLKKLGLRNERGVKERDLIGAAQQAANMWSRNQQSVAMRIAGGIWTYLQMYGEDISSSTLNTLSSIPCLPCLQDAEKPRDYPVSLPLQSSPMLVRPTEVSVYELLSVAGSVVPILKPGMSETVTSCLHVTHISKPEVVLQHLQKVILHFQRQDASKYKSLLNESFQHLEQHVSDPSVIRSLRERKCILVESGECFASPDSFWIQRKYSDIDLKPYRFPVPMEMMHMTSLFEACGSSKYQSEELLLNVLSEIESKYSSHDSGHKDFNMDFKLVKQIVDILKTGDAAGDGKTLLPINHGNTGVLRFKPARECTISPGSGRSSALAFGESEIFYVHPDISHKTALDLGALLMKDRALTGVEDLDFGYEQHEELTTRLHNLLKESYTDGFSVPKELIQNADDACASKVWFLLDERENLTARTNLIAESMAGLQGPAVWAYNDAVFSDDDFKNIVKLGAGTKKDDAAKVGRFGLGFNAVYNLTDVPCFISRHQMAMFDPQRKYLEKGAGLKLDFRRAINQNLLARMPEQFQPFQNVFDCTLQSQTQTFYNGTLFRFPLRTEEQADSSELKAESYTKEKRRQFLKMLLEKAGGLLMFTQSVREVQVFHLPSNCSSPTAAKCLLTVKKNCLQTVVIHPQVQLANKTILQFVKECWPRNKDIRIHQKIQIDMTVTEDAKAVCSVDTQKITTQWHLAWASGNDKSANMAGFHRQEGLVPLAAVAISLTVEGLRPLKHSPPGFYKTGHLFCFLPLPEEMAHVTLPVHVNGTFALTSDRRGLMVQTEDDLDSRGSSWNSALYGDAVCRAYLLLLELVKKEAAMDDDFSRYFDLWPKTSVPCLVDSFYWRLESDGNTVLPVPNSTRWVAFKEARFLQPQLRSKGCGKIAWDALQRFWKGSGYPVDVPSAICELMAQKAPSKSFEAKVITELQFYRDFFFPNLLSDWWQPEHRDTLIRHALMQNDKKLDELLKNSACIPCEGSKRLRKPSELVSPKGQVAKLFLTSEGRFPQTVRKENQAKEGLQKDMKRKQEAQESKTVDFCDSKPLQRLSALGMMTDELPWDLVLDRAQSVKHLNAAEGMQKSLCRAANLIEYLSAIQPANSKFAFEKCPPEVKNSLSQIAFLPVLSRPKDWPFPWAGDGTSDHSCLESPGELVSDALKHLVGCKANLLNTIALNGSSAFLSGKKREVLKSLGLVVQEEYGNGKLLQFVVEQLITVAKHYNASSGNDRELTQLISNDIYSFLTTCLKREEIHDIHALIQNQLWNKDIVWTGTCFVRPSLVAFQCQYDCSPYLFELEQSHLPRRRLCFEAVKVKLRFEASDVMTVLEKIAKDNSGTELSRENVGLASRLAQLLGEIARSVTEAESLDRNKVFLPDRHGVMQPASRLCVDDCPWVKETERLKFVSGSIPPETAQLLGVRTKRRQHYYTLTKSIRVEPFHQTEKLTTRIKRLLQGYTFDSSLFKELMQNADDAGATECKLIMDFRQLGTETVPDNWDELQGPALCFYNNKSFTEKDMQGIQNMGVGSKAQDALTTGQFGVGFNAVFHITDVPSFWTREDDKKEVICVLDPNCKYVPYAESGEAEGGVKFVELEETRQSYPDMLSGYLGNAIDMSQSGTLFRFPLRTQDMANSSEIKQECVTKSTIEHLLDDFKKEMSTCLLFLNNLQSVGICSVNEDGSLNDVFKVNKTVEESSCQQLSDFKTSLLQASVIMEQTTTRVTDIPVSEAVVLLNLTDSKGSKEQWLTVHRVGFIQGTNLSQELQNEWRSENFRLLPRGGVAVRYGHNTPQGNPQQPSDVKYQTFCTLPLPVYTNLPMHVNGHFALDHETRRNLWDRGDHKKDTKAEWNDAIAVEIIVPAYVTALQHMNRILFPVDGKDFSNTLMVSNLKKYHDLFPQQDLAASEFWKKMMQEIYKALAKQELSVFPAFCPWQGKLEWISAVTKSGFPGHFNNLVVFFKRLINERQPQRLHTSTIHRGANEPNPRQLAKDLQLLLKGLNMKILEAPFHVYENFKASGVDEVKEVTPETVLTFIQSAGQGTLDACSINNLPQPVTSTPLMTVDNVKRLVDFVSKATGFLDCLDALPLCLRQSGLLHRFSHVDPKPIISRFNHLLPGSSEDFLHTDILRYFSNSDKALVVLQKLTIPILVSKLQDTLKDSYFSAGKPCPFDDHKLPYKFWVHELWKFLETELKEKEKTPSNQSKGGNNSDVEELHRAEEKLQSLRKWCIIPVKEYHGHWKKSMLYPVRDLHHVVYLSASSDRSNGSLWKILRSLPLPFLDELHLPGLSIATKLVASISHPRALLHALAACADRLSASHEEGRTVLDYFSKNMNNLCESCADETELKQEIRQLPVFPSLDGNLVSLASTVPALCLESVIPEEGLIAWSKSLTHPVLLLRRGYVPRELSEYLGLKTLSNAEFYCQYLLPNLGTLSHEAIPVHMQFLRYNFRWYAECDTSVTDEIRQLHCQLKATAFVAVHGTLFRARDFFSPHETVFQTMCNSEQFPPEPYCQINWEEFMIAAGMIYEVTTDMFLDFARVVENEERVTITPEVKRKSQMLVRHLFSRKNLAQDWLLSELRGIHFLMPSQWTSTEEGQKLATIAQPFCPSRLVSFGECCFEEHLDLLWSSSCILHQDADPRTHMNGNRKAILDQLGLHESAPKDKVIQHVKNVCQALSGDKGRQIFNSLSGNGQRFTVLNVMEKIYRYLESNISSIDISILKQLPIICDTDNSQMLNPAKVVIDLRQNEMIRGHIEKAPHHFGRYFDLFIQLGAAEHVSANHYAIVLEWLKADAGNEQLHAEERKIVKIAVEGLFRCLKETDTKTKEIAVNHLYLPTEEMRLEVSTAVIFKDRRFGERFKERPEDMHFFLGFTKLEMIVSKPLEEVKLLPKEHQMVMVSDIVKEVIPDNIRDNAVEGVSSTELIRRLQHPNVVSAIIRLVYHHHYMNDRQFTAESADHVKVQLSNVSAKEITNLKTVLTLHDRPVPNSDFSKQSFTEKIKGPPRCAVVYVDTEVNGAMSPKDSVVHSLVLAVMFVLKTDLNEYCLHSVLKSENLANAMDILEDFGIVQCDFSNVVEESIFPVPGTFVPVHHHCYLDNSFSEFYRGEHVGFEVYDPDIEYEESEDSDAIYIYALVMEEVCPSGIRDVPMLAKRYRIYLGVDRGEAEVSVTKLYKFVRRARRSTCKDIVEYKGQNGAADENNDNQMPLRDVLKEIRSILSEAWQRFPDARDRRRVVKRLLLRWHPDKNPGRESFCTRVTQNIFKYEKLLNEGKALPENDDGESGHETETVYRSGSTFSPSFYAHMNSRARSHRAQYDSFESEFSHSSGRWSRQANPQPGEGRRWLRQAQADITAGRAAKGICDRGRNWICYQCHQAAEKALKAVIYYRDANLTNTLSHNLPQLAYAIDDSLLTDLALQLEQRLGPHTRMRYPDVVVYPSVPSDVYTDDDVSWACDVTTRLVDRVQSLIQG